MKSFAAILFACFCSLVAGRVSADTEVKFANELADSGSTDVVVIQVPEGSVLVFDEGPHYLNGRDIIVYAARAEVRGLVSIGSWDPNVIKPSPPGVPPTPAVCGGTACTGRKGNPGAAGNTGDPGSLIYLDIDAFSATPGSTLEVLANGQTGGKGQHGGNGGPGGTGPSGANAGGLPCDNPCPERGGVGGPGGQAGAAGIGGDGGRGGTVRLGIIMHALHASGASSFKAIALGGPGGPAGDPGQGGDGGGGGPRGAGSRLCTCSNPPGPGPQGPRGSSTPDPTPPSAPGSPGTVVPII
ncbi:MAG: hypothetical protein ACXW4P_04085 [Thermoanaerobaculia bacterium]